MSKELRDNMILFIKFQSNDTSVVYKQGSRRVRLLPAEHPGHATARLGRRILRGGRAPSRRSERRPLAGGSRRHGWSNLSGTYCAG